MRLNTNDLTLTIEQETYNLEQLREINEQYQTLEIFSYLKKNYLNDDEKLFSTAEKLYSIKREAAKYNKPISTLSAIESLHDTSLLKDNSAYLEYLYNTGIIMNDSYIDDNFYQPYLYYCHPAINVNTSTNTIKFEIAPYILLKDEIIKNYGDDELNKLKDIETKLNDICDFTVTKDSIDGIIKHLNAMGFITYWQITETNLRKFFNNILSYNFSNYDDETFYEHNMNGIYFEPFISINELTVLN